MSDSNYVVRGELGSYEVFVDEKLGEGGFGQVFEAKNEGTGERLAIKLFLARDPRVLSGIHAQRQLDHPRLLPVRDAGTDRGQAFLVMDRAHGTVAARLEGGPLADHDAVLAFYDAALALRYLHDRGLVHRDVKPSNMLLDARGRVLLSDFDLVQEVAVETRTVVNSAAGTFAYCAPELFGTTGCSPAADVWALGISMYELLAGRRPFEGNLCDGSLLKALREGQPPSLVEQRPESEFWAELIAPLLAKRPEERVKVGGLFGGRFRTFVRYAVDVCWERQEYARAFDLLSAADRTPAMMIDLVLAGAAAGKKMTNEPRLEDPGLRLQRAMQAALAVAQECPAIAPQVRDAILGSLQEELAPAFDDVALARELGQGPPFVGPEREQCGAVATASSDRYLARYPNGRDAERLRGRARRPGTLIAEQVGVFERIGFDAGGLLFAQRSTGVDVYSRAGAKEASFPHDGSVRGLAVSPFGRVVVTTAKRAMTFDGLTPKYANHSWRLLNPVWLDEELVAIFDQEGDVVGYSGGVFRAVQNYKVARDYGPIGALAPDAVLMASKARPGEFATLRLTPGTLVASLVSGTVRLRATPLCLRRPPRLLTPEQLLKTSGEVARTFERPAEPVLGGCASHDESVALFFGARTLAWRLLDERLAELPIPEIAVGERETILAAALDATGARLALSVQVKNSTEGSLRVYWTGFASERAA